VDGVLGGNGEGRACGTNNFGGGFDFSGGKGKDRFRANLGKAKSPCRGARSLRRRSFNSWGERKGGVCHRKGGECRRGCLGKIPPFSARRGEGQG